jgi:phenylalanyl-tRNA synthetase beta chain
MGGLVEALAGNLRRKQSRVRLFEQGRCFLRDKNAGNASLVTGYQQPVRLAALAYGAAAPEGWGGDGRKVDFFDLKGDLEALLAPAELAFTRVDHPALHPGRAASVSLEGQAIGVIGELHPQWAQKYDLPAAPVVFEITLEAAARGHLPVYADVSRFQPAIRDLALVVDQALPLREVLDAMKKCAPPLVCDIQLFDMYQGKGIPEGKKSLAFRIVMQDTERTLLDTEIDSTVAEITAYLERNLAARLRA